MYTDKHADINLWTYLISGDGGSVAGGSVGDVNVFGGGGSGVDGIGGGSRTAAGVLLRLHPNVREPDATEQHVASK